MGSSESTGPLANELEMASQGPNDNTLDYQRLMEISNIFQDMHNLATSLNPQGDLEPKNDVPSDGVQTSLLEGLVSDGVLAFNDEEKVTDTEMPKTMDSILTYLEESIGVSKSMPVKSTLVNFNTKHNSRIQEKE